jgi:hypothetical protein
MVSEEIEQIELDLLVHFVSTGSAKATQENLKVVLAEFSTIS